jgi:hypothetical protein
MHRRQCTVRNDMNGWVVFGSDRRTDLGLNGLDRFHKGSKPSRKLLTYGCAALQRDRVAH